MSRKILGGIEMKSLMCILLLNILFSCPLSAANYQKIYLDDKRNVHVITTKGNDIQLTTAGRGTNVRLSPDGTTATWIIVPDQRDESEIDDSGSELAVFRNGRIGLIKCEPFIREYWFWMKGDRIAIDCGGMHFAGREILYDIDTLTVIESFDQASLPTDKRPRWSESSEQFSPDE